MQDIKILSQSEDNCSIEISIDNHTCLVNYYNVLPGIRFAFIDSHVESIDFQKQDESKNIIEITHCREGRMECHFHDKFCYIGTGDMMIARKDNSISSVYFPLHHFHGLTIQIDLDEAPDCFSSFLEDVIVSPREMANKFCNNHVYISRTKSSLEHIFSELYAVSDQIKKGYFKVKALELFLFLSQLDVSKEDLDGNTLTKTQVDIVKAISQYLMSHKDERITLKQLTQIFHISGTHIKNTFKNVYGVSLGSYVRTQKMESAAYMLEYTHKSILEIASDHGYDNASKFAKAFKSVKGMSPNEYRNLNIVK